MTPGGLILSSLLLKLSEVRLDHLAVSRRGHGVGFDSLTVPESNPTSFEGLPANWRVAEQHLRLVTVDDKLQLLGKGGFGYVYEAEVNKDEAAVKIVKGGSDKDKARLLHEIKLLESIKVSVSFKSK